MKRQLHKFVMFSFCFAINVNCYSQLSKSRQQPVTVVNYNNNVNAQLSSKELALITEVYGEKTNEYVLNRPQRMKDIKNILRNRVEYKLAEPGTIIKECPLLSEVALFDNYNNNLERDKSFDPKSFNPLKYMFNFYSKGAYMYRVDKTDYYIIIKSQHQ